ncbi:MAG: Ppx/GppA family phosphatase [Aeriscardovia sp.]|nr:Ppx/GppA family phosphatase [Aeriscardovia sp.]
MVKTSLRVAGIDCGTNSIRLVIADVDNTGMHVVYPKRLDVVRLGEGVDKNHYFLPEALNRTFAVCREYAEIIASYHADVIRFIATSASRDAQNRQEFEQGIHDILGIKPEIISGDQEAQLSFLGATSLLESKKDLHTPLLVVDLGGGSTELVLGGTGTHQHDVQSAISLNIGCVRMAERYQLSSAPSAEQLHDAISDIDQQLQYAVTKLPLHTVQGIIGVSGTVTTTSLISMGEHAYSREKIDGITVDIMQAERACSLIESFTQKDMENYPVIHPDRRDVVIGGVVIWSRLLHLMTELTKNNEYPVTSYVASENGVVEGAILDTANLHF